MLQRKVIIIKRDRSDASIYHQNSQLISGWFHGFQSIDGQAHVFIENTIGEIEYYNVKEYRVVFINQDLEIKQHEKNFNQAH